MIKKTRKPNHPGIILDGLYIQPLQINLQELADYLGISRNTLFKIRIGKASVTPSIAIRLSETFETTPLLWLNLQQKYDLWIEENRNDHLPLASIYNSGLVIKSKSRPFKKRSKATKHH